MKDIQELDYKEAAKILAEEFKKLGVTTAIRGGYLIADTHPQDDRWAHYHFNVEFRLGEAVTSFDWKQGTGVVTQTAAGKSIPKAPKPAEVLGSVCRDYLDAIGSSFPDWASNFGYERDSVKARKIYDSCIEEGEKLRHLGLMRCQITHFAEISRQL